MAKAHGTTGVSVIPPERIKTYKRSDVKTQSGQRCLDNDDDVARRLRGMSRSDLESHAVKTVGADRVKKWSKLNDGMLRMNLGNMLRATLRGKVGKKTGRPKKGRKVKKAA